MRTPILIIENNRSHLQIESLALAEENFDIHSAGSAEEAFRQLGEFQPELILMGFELPDMDGLELTRQLKADPRYQHITIVAVTAHGMPEDRIAAFQAGCDGYISKPIDVEKFPQLINDYIVKAKKNNI